jgi:deazaflavin-dependent oxidoreductase (nitroreductase family)
MDFNAINRKVIREFRENDGVVGGYFEGMPLVLLHTTGAKSGEERINPLAYLSEGDRDYVFASKGGARSNPDWYYNLVANPEVTVEKGTQTYPARAIELDRAERDRVYAIQAAGSPQFGDYEKTAAPRVIPVFALERSGG